MNHRNRFPARRRFLKQSAALSASASLAAPAAVLAQVRRAPTMVGLLPGAPEGQREAVNAWRAAALLALRDFNEVRPSDHGAARAALAPGGLSDPTACAAALGRMHAQHVRGMVALLTPAMAAALAAHQPFGPGAAVLSVRPRVLGAAPMAGESGRSRAWPAWLRQAPPSLQPALLSAYGATYLLADCLHRTVTAEALTAALQAGGATLPIEADDAEAIHTVIVVAGEAPATPGRG